jgi:excisionase family DNA binding protein
MTSLDPEIIDCDGVDLEPLAVSPRQACILLGVGVTRLYQLLRNDELESYQEGRARRITMRSIHRRITRLLASASATGIATEAMPQPRSSRKAKQEQWAGRRRRKPQQNESESSTP